MVIRFKCYNLPFFGWWDGNVDKYSHKCHMIDMYRGVATLNKLIIIDGDAEEVCNFGHIETIYIRLHEKKI